MEIVELKDLIKAERRKYFKDWRTKNKDKVKEHNRRYWEKRVRTAQEQADTEKGGGDNVRNQ